jgi:hypothetical protein
VDVPDGREPDQVGRGDLRLLDPIPWHRDPDLQHRSGSVRRRIFDGQSQNKSIAVPEHRGSLLFSRQHSEQPRVERLGRAFRSNMKPELGSERKALTGKRERPMVLGKQDVDRETFHESQLDDLAFARDLPGPQDPRAAYSNHDLITSQTLGDYIGRHDDLSIDAHVQAPDMDGQFP